VNGSEEVGRERDWDWDCFSMASSHDTVVVGKRVTCLRDLRRSFPLFGACSRRNRWAFLCLSASDIAAWRVVGASGQADVMQVSGKAG
jgi:hypothetical protein